MYAYKQSKKGCFQWIIKPKNNNSVQVVIDHKNVFHLNKSAPGYIILVEKTYTIG